MNDAKIRLSSKEMDLVSNADWILTKNGILQKVKHLLEELLITQQDIVPAFQSVLPQEVAASSPKISRGENYNGLPYLVLDYPRLFNRDNIFAIRTMFWWGNFFSTTLHLSGVYKTAVEQKIIVSYSLLAISHAFICIGEEEWEHHFDDNNYQSIKAMTEDDVRKIIQQKKFLKLAYRIPLQEWDNVLTTLPGHFTELLKLLDD